MLTKQEIKDIRSGDWVRAGGVWYSVYQEPMRNTVVVVDRPSGLWGLPLERIEAVLYANES